MNSIQPPRLVPIGRLSRRGPSPASAASPSPDGAFSPSTDAGYASSEDGDSLQTPLIEAGDLFPTHSAHAHTLYPPSFAPTHPTPTKHPKPLSPLDPFCARPTYGAAPGFAPFSSSSPQRAAPARTPAEFDTFDASPVDFNTQIWGAPPPGGLFAAGAPAHRDAAPQLPPIALPSLMIQLDEDSPSRALFLDTSSDVFSVPPSPCASSPELHFATDGRAYSPRFPAGHYLNPYFVDAYELGDELGAGGYGFVMTARNRTERHEVAVKFIIKDKVPEHAWIDDDLFGRLPTEVMLVSILDHENIVKCLDVFEDDYYFYLVSPDCFIMHIVP